MKKTIIFLLISSFFINSAKAQCNDKVLYTMGGISTLALYNTYLSIGTVGDSYSSKVYDENKVQELMTEQVNMIAVINEMMDDVIALTGTESLTVPDLKFIKEIKVTLEYLKAEAAALKDYTLDSSTASIESYHTNRNLAWAKISELMGLDN